MKTEIPLDKWEWFGSAGHLIVARWCRFHLCTLVGKFIVSTVGEFWPDRTSRDIHAKIHNPKWFEKNGQLKGDAYDAAYMNEFGFETVGYDRKYETMVFPWKGVRCECGCGMPKPSDWSEIGFAGYNEAGAASKGHLAMCKEFARKGITR